MINEVTLPIGKKNIRAVIADGDVWFTALDLYDSQNRFTDKKHLACFDRRHLRLHTFPTDKGPKRLTLVSTLGAITVAKGFPRPTDRIMDAWVRKQVQLLGFDRPAMLLVADGGLPTMPKDSIWNDRWDWDALKAANPTARRNPPQADVPELDDDDVPAPPVKPTQAEIDADWEAMMDAEREIVTLPTKAKKPRHKPRQ
ncbi:hypothetical protein [Sphingomonas kyungheensis]|uniref:Bro-N domain-containing protein n=1 Tax=Sphingomonas kyungheensis TaxID=1069987 RepID=A0ABU8H656_9SPHN